MACDRPALSLSRLLDGELGLFARLRLQRHVAGCEDCAARLEELRAMQAAMRTKLTYHRAPPGLATRIAASLPREAAPAVFRPRFRLPAFSLAGTGLAGALAGVALTLLVIGHGEQGDMMQAVIGSHIRSLQAEHLTDVATSDQHTVKPWLSARLDVSPPVRELKDQGFPLRSEEHTSELQSRRDLVCRLLLEKKKKKKKQTMVYKKKKRKNKKKKTKTYH